MPGSCRPSPYPGNLEHPRLSEQEGCRAKETREGKGPHRAAKRRPFLRGTGPDTPLPFNGALCTGAAAACCEMIIFCFLPVHGLMFSSSSEEKEWENIEAYIPSQRAAEIAFSQKSSWFCILWILRAARPLKHVASRSQTSLSSGSPEKWGWVSESEQRMWEKLDGETTFGEGS